MAPFCETGSAEIHEVVVSEDARSRDAHMEVFRLRRDAYRYMGGDLYGALTRSVVGGALRVHVSCGWKWLLRLTFGRRDFGKGELVSLLKTAGLTDDDLRPFRTANPDDIFYFLYYGKRFDVLRRLCRSAKRRSEELPETGAAKIEFHLVAPEDSRIIASSI
ncbi:hypothetical protein BMS3Bbin06_01740 [bacterium BMS3Bbin06]|nr:hypothetical protein BMS3Abin08_01937 [bacterium BMS3Abin08]GBE35202.1 hypothetical protein BMS3Bbin06_01740 [bacterium BMS3Bbin06]HDO35415.1 hypothetical protein [Nitrospirota bacterium]HDY72176.1 hypothetical protein [Nitrospirota bacterium]